MADCHPDRKHRGKGMCKKCYDRHYRTNPETRPIFLSAMKRWYQSNKDYADASSKEWHRNNPEKSRAIKNKWLEGNSDKRKEVVREWDRRNPQVARDKRHRRRSAKDSGIDCAPKIALLLRKHFCNWCCDKIAGHVTIDHVVPLARGGEHIPDNLVAACRHCNSSKGAKLLSEWRIPATT